VQTKESEIQNSNLHVEKRSFERQKQTPQKSTGLFGGSQPGLFDGYIVNPEDESAGK
jgi:hypothetical protein